MAVTTETQASPVVTTPALVSRIRHSFFGAALNGRFAFALIVFLAIVAFGFLGPLVSGRTKVFVTVGGLYDAPSADALLGTDNFGRDIFTQLMYGTRTSLVIGVIAGSVATLLGLFIGTVSGYVGGI